MPILLRGYIAKATNTFVFVAYTTVPEEGLEPPTHGL